MPQLLTNLAPFAAMRNGFGAGTKRRVLAFDDG
jgi:hypothetical protein